jgi:Amt family ammonium transporter
MWLLVLVLLSCSLGLAQDRGPDPSGASTGGAADVTAKEAGKPTMEELAAQVGHNKVAINMVWGPHHRLSGDVHADRFRHG